MIKYLFFLFVLTVQSAFLYPATANISCAPELRSCLESIQQLPEARALLAAIQQEGNIQIAVNKNQLPATFGAFWDMDRRVIFVTLSSARTKGSLIASILFELHNALANSKLNELDRLAMERKINRQTYMEAVERVEYQNSLKASALSRQGIQRGIFPETAFLPTYSTFEEYYRIQQSAGHSFWIGRTYDQLTGRF